MRKIIALIITFFASTVFAGSFEDFATRQVQMNYLVTAKAYCQLTEAEWKALDELEEDLAKGEANMELTNRYSKQEERDYWRMMKASTHVASEYLAPKESNFVRCAKVGAEILRFQKVEPAQVAD